MNVSSGTVSVFLSVNQCARASALDRLRPISRLGPRTPVDSCARPLGTPASAAKLDRESIWCHRLSMQGMMQSLSISSKHVVISIWSRTVDKTVNFQLFGFFISFARLRLFNESFGFTKHHVRGTVKTLTIEIYWSVSNFVCRQFLPGADLLI